MNTTPNLMPMELRKECEADPAYKVCSRVHEGGCQGRITFEHAIIYAAKRLQKKWAIISLCEHHHAANRHMETGDLNKEVNICIALNRATDDELRAISKADNYIAKRDLLNKRLPFVLENMKKPLPKPKPLGDDTYLPRNDYRPGAFPREFHIPIPKRIAERIVNGMLGPATAMTEMALNKDQSEEREVRALIGGACKQLGDAFLISGDKRLQAYRDNLEAYLVEKTK